MLPEIKRFLCGEANVFFAVKKTRQETVHLV